MEISDAPGALVTPTNLHLAEVIGTKMGNDVYLWCYPGWSDEDFDAAVRHYNLWDAPAEKWSFYILEPPMGGIIEVFHLEGVA